MELPLGIRKYIYQFQAMMPNYDTECPFSKDEPLSFEDRENVKLAFVALADTHIVNNEFAFKNLNNAFEDIKNSGEKFDALLLAGDIADYGFKSEYKGFLDVYSKQDAVPHIFLTLGNHDARFFYGRARKTVMDWQSKHLGIDIGKKSYYSYDINGYTFIVICTEKAVLEKAYISKEQIAFLDNELKRATENGKPAFVMCHQAFQFTHGLPEVWKTGDMGEQSDEVRAVMEKYNNVFFINGHLHGGICNYVEEVLNEEKGVVSLSIPSYRKPNNFGHRDCGTGYYCCVYDDRVEFTARNFLTGKPVTGDYTKFTYKLK
ncbi:MAG: metallophosphoesterase [Clostridia bacterium]|nr:metallophosphoesterase [Clostridia bacterium]